MLCKLLIIYDGNNISVSIADDYSILFWQHLFSFTHLHSVVKQKSCQF